MTTSPLAPLRLEAGGVVLRPYVPGDADDVRAALADPEIARWNPGPGGADAVEQFMRERNDWSAGDHASWAVADLDDRLVGSVSVYKIDPVHEDAQVGYWVAPWARRRGYAASAVLAAARFAFGRLGLRRLSLYHAVENTGSCGVALAAGFRHEGTMRESYRYADGVHHDEHVHGLLARDLRSAP